MDYSREPVPPLQREDAITSNEHGNHTWFDKGNLYAE